MLEILNLPSQVINGTTLYSSELFPPPTPEGIVIQGKLVQNYTTGAGETLSFTANETGRYIWSGEWWLCNGVALRSDFIGGDEVALNAATYLENVETDSRPLSQAIHRPQTRAFCIRMS